MDSDWQTQRVRLNHNWLKNRYLRLLNNFINRIDGKKTDQSRIEVFKSKIFHEWADNTCLFNDLVKRSIIELSPKNLFKNFPLTECNEYYQNWLLDLSHELWLKQYKMDNLQINAFETINQINKLYETILDSFITCSIDHIKLNKNIFIRYYEELKKLSDLIHCFPDEVLFI